MTLRGRLAVLCALVVGIILSAGSITCYAVIRHQLRGQVDDTLEAQARSIAEFASMASAFSGAPEASGMADGLGGDPFSLFPGGLTGKEAPIGQIIMANGRVVRSKGTTSLPVTGADREIARAGRGQQYGDRRANGHHVRVLTQATSTGAVELARPLDAVDSILARLRLVLGLLIVGGLVAATLSARLFSRRVLAPIAALTTATTEIQATGDLARRVDADRADEVGALAAGFNAMLGRLQETQGALTRSTAAQRQLVADASHELRTPLAGLRTNIEVLLADRALSDDDGQQGLMADVVEQTAELTAVINDLIELARGDAPPVDHEDVDLGELLLAAVTRTRRHAPTMTFDADVEPWIVSGSRERLSRAFNNVLDNAAKFSPPGSPVAVTLADGVLTVSDEGPGVPPADLPLLFERFFRGTQHGMTPGSGLGLAIVKQVAEAHNATVSAHAGSNGGLTVAIDFSASDSQPLRS